MAKSTQSMLDTRRSPRVHIKYEVRVGDAIVDKELPLVVGVMGDYSGNNSKAERKPLAERKFVEISRDNFDEVMKKIAPGLNIRIKSTMSKETDAEMPIQLEFNSMEDFEPGQIVKQIPHLKELLDTRNKLRELLLAAEKKPNLERELEKILQSQEHLEQLGRETTKPQDE
ncbi:MAG: type VI secretion system contractile sheath small subunit [Planctomycetaceae bacterium]